MKVTLDDFSDDVLYDTVADILSDALDGEYDEPLTAFDIKIHMRDEGVKIRDIPAVVRFIRTGGELGPLNDYEVLLEDAPDWCFKVVTGRLVWKAQQEWNAWNIMCKHSKGKVIWHSGRI